jgi:hypothetical protein
MGLVLFLASIVFTLFLIDIADKLAILEFAGRSPQELVYKLAIEFILITGIFTTTVYYIYRQSVLPYSKNRFQLFAGIITVTILLASFGMVVVQSNIGDAKNKVENIKDNIVQVLPIKHDLDPRRELFMGMIEENTPEYLDARMMDISERFFWQKEYEDYKIGEHVIVKYRVNPKGQKIIDKIKLARRDKEIVRDEAADSKDTSSSSSSISLMESKNRKDNSGKGKISSDDSDDKKALEINSNSGKDNNSESSSSSKSSAKDEQNDELKKILEQNIKSQKEELKRLEDQQKDLEDKIEEDQKKLEDRNGKDGGR